MSTESDEVTRRVAVGSLVREVRERKGWSVVRAVAEASKSPDTEIGRSRWTQIEQGHAPMATAATLARVALTLGVEPEQLWSVAGYTAQAERWRAARDLGAEIAPVPADELTQLDADILDVLQEIRTELRRLGDAYEQLAGSPPVPPPSGAPPGRRAGRAVRPAAPASE